MKRYIKNNILLIIGFIFIIISFVLLYINYLSAIQPDNVKELQKEINTSIKMQDTPEKIVTELNQAKIKRNMSIINCIGWIYIPDSNINYPIMQYTDNEYYLSHNSDNKTSSYGSIFLDSRCDIDSNIILIHGHNCKQKIMFSELKNYYNNSTYKDTHSIIYLCFKNQEFESYRIKDIKIIEETDKLYSLSATGIYLSTCYGIAGTDKRLIIELEKGEENEKKS